MEAVNIVELGIRASVRRSEAVISRLKPYVENISYQSNSPINGTIKVGVLKEAGNAVLKTLELFKTVKKGTLTIPKHLRASARPNAANIVDVVCIVKFGRELKLVPAGKKIGLNIKGEESLKKDKKVGRVEFSFPMANAKVAQSLVGLINAHEKIERINPGK